MSRPFDTSHLKNELLDVIFSRSGIRLLSILLFKPSIEAHQAELVSASGLSRMTVARLLKTFEKHNLLKVSKKGDLKLYSTVEGDPIIKQLKIFINVTEIRTRIKGFAGKGMEVYLFGSAARGEDTRESDIDLLIITDKKKDIIFKALGKLRYALNREVNPIIYTPMEYSKLPVTDMAFYEGFERDKIRLI